MFKVKYACLTAYAVVVYSVLTPTYSEEGYVSASKNAYPWCGIVGDNSCELLTSQVLRQPIRATLILFCLTLIVNYLDYYEVSFAKIKLYGERDISNF